MIGNILRAVEAGAINYLLKDSPRKDILAAVRTAATGRSAEKEMTCSTGTSCHRAPPAEALSGRRPSADARGSPSAPGGPVWRVRGRPRRTDPVPGRLPRCLARRAARDSEESK